MVGRQGPVVNELPLFWRLFTKLVQALLKERAHAEVILTIRDGKIQLVRINRSYQPGNLPDV